MPIFLNNIKIINYKFSAGECHVKNIHLIAKNKNKIVAFLKNSDDFMLLLITIDALRRSAPDCEIDLELPYLPYSRQDRVCAPGDAYSLSVISKIIDDLNLNSVLVADLHSDIPKKLIKNLKNKIEIDLLNNDLIKILDQYDYFICPDNGCKKRIENFYKISQKKVAFFDKVRSENNTKVILSSHEFYQLKDKNCIIIDDICDGGRTFVNLAKYLNENNATPSKISLYVTTGIFSYGLNDLRKHFNNIYCNHTFLKNDEIEKNKDFLTVFNIYEDDNEL